MCFSWSITLMKIQKIYIHVVGTCRIRRMWIPLWRQCANLSWELPQQRYVYIAPAVPHALRCCIYVHMFSYLKVVRLFYPSHCIKRKHFRCSFYQRNIWVLRKRITKYCKPMVKLSIKLYLDMINYEISMS